MKLANIYALDGGGVRRGQAPTGTTDANCLDLLAADSSGTKRNITRVVATDGGGRPTDISRRLITTAVNDYRYLDGGTTSAYGAGIRFNNAILINGIYQLACGWEGNVIFEKFPTASEGKLALIISGNYGSTYNWFVFGVTNDGYLYCETRHGDNITAGYGGRLSLGVPTHIVITSPYMLGQAATRTLTYTIGTAPRGTFTTAKGGATDAQFALFSEYSTRLDFRCMGIVKYTGFQKLTGCDGDALHTSSFNIESLPVGATTFNDNEGLTYWGDVSANQHQSTRYSWEI